MLEHLPADLGQFVADALASGEYPNEADLILTALYVLKDRHDWHRMKYEALKRDIALGIEQADRGQVAPLDMKAVMAKVRERLAAPEDGE
jgi:antitoxin ParD1/3/4